eukprot:TRINITY_DN247_c0_g1_i1.p1 TRINITY_DN247_c0_g1~~TRINITY_DN247_c0_g1_i1.p1  ORF type:complete len:382 (-),score=42.84 TRINITY_DN247_c0_g1_i1:52-1032(-)
MENLATQLSLDSSKWGPITWWRKWRELRRHVKEQRSWCLNIPGRGKSVKNYYFDLMSPDNKTAVALKLVRDPDDPKLLVHYNSSWSFPDMLSQELKNATVQSLSLVPKKLDGSGVAKHDYELSLYDVQYIKRLDMKTVDKHDRPPKGIEIAIRAPRRAREACFSPSCFVANRFVGGSYYALDTALRELKKQMKEHEDDVVSKEFSGKPVKETPFLTISPKFVRTAVTIGAVAAGVAFPYAFGVLGAVQAVGVLAAIPGYWAGEHITRALWPVTAAEKLFDKLWCLSNRYVKHNQGRSFYYCQDAYKNFMLVPWKTAEALDWDCSVF